MLEMTNRRLRRTWMRRSFLEKNESMRDRLLPDCSIVDRCASIGYLHLLHAGKQHSWSRVVLLDSCTCLHRSILYDRDSHSRAPNYLYNNRDRIHHSRTHSSSLVAQLDRRRGQPFHSALLDRGSIGCRKWDDARRALGAWWTRSQTTISARRLDIHWLENWVLQVGRFPTGEYQFELYRPGRMYSCSPHMGWDNDCTLRCESLPLRKGNERYFSSSALKTSFLTQIEIDNRSETFDRMRVTIIRGIRSNETQRSS